MREPRGDSLNASRKVALIDSRVAAVPVCGAQIRYGPSVPITQLRQDFQQLKLLRKLRPNQALDAVGNFGRDAVRVLSEHTEFHSFEFKGQGTKNYDIAARPGTQVGFSRAINRDLFIPDMDDYASRWSALASAVRSSAGQSILSGVESDEVNRLVYSAVIGYAAAVDLFNPGDRGGPGSYLEMVMGPIVSILTARQEGASISLPVPETGEVEVVTTDLSFVGDEGEIVLVVPTKISTRERISQAYVHQLILDRAKETTGITYRSALVIANENNTMFPKGLAAAAKTYEVGWTQETLVPGTIVLYHKYVSQLSGLYYLDPPNRYVLNPPATFPKVSTVGALLTSDLPELLEAP